MRTATAAALLILFALAGCGDDPPADPTTATAVEDENPLCAGLGSRLPEPDVLERAESLLVGEPLDAAERIAEQNGCHIAPTSIDGEPQALTREYDPTRIQVEVSAGEVRRVNGFG